MSRRAAFSQADVSRALKGVKAAGEPIRGVEIDPNGNIRIVLGEPPPAAAAATGNEWDEVLR
jgi:hypothetical protein